MECRWFRSVSACLYGAQLLLSEELLNLENETAADAVISALTDLFEQYPEIDVNDFRRIHLLTVLNTDFEPVCMIEDSRFCHLLKCLPKLSQFLYFKIVSHFKWFDYVGEVVVHCPEVLSVAVLDCILKYADDISAESAIDIFRVLYYSMYQKICHLHDSDNKHKKIKMVNKFAAVCRVHLPDHSKGKGWTTEKKEQYFGYVVRMTLNTIENCIVVYKRSSLLEECEMYNVNIVFDYSTWQVTVEDKDWRTFALDAMVTKGMKLVQDVTVNIYMAWCEVDVSGSEEKTLQMAVREACWTCQEALESISSESDSIIDLLDFINVLKNMSLKPKSEDDEIREANLRTLLVNLQNPNRTQWKWLKAFVCHPDVLQDDFNLSTIKQFSYLLTPESVIGFIDVILNEVQHSLDSLERNEKFKSTLFACMKQLPISSQIEILRCYLVKHGSKVELLMKNDFTVRMTEFFNKMVRESDCRDTLLPDVICFAMQSARRLLNKIIDESLSSKYKCEFCVEFLKTCPPIRSLPADYEKYTSLLMEIIVVKGHSTMASGESESSNYSFFVYQLCDHKIIPGKEYLFEHAIPSWEASLSSRKWNEILFWLDVLEPFIKNESDALYEQKLVLIMVFMAQALEKCRVNPISFCNTTAVTVEKCVELLTILRDYFFQSSPAEAGHEIQWARSILSSLSPLNMYHVRHLWTNYGKELPVTNKRALLWIQPKFGVHNFCDLDKQGRTMLVADLCKVLPELCSTEWKMIADSNKKTDWSTGLAMFYTVADCLIVLSKVKLMLNNLLCLSNCLSNFAIFFKARILPVLKFVNNEDGLNVVSKIVGLFTDLPAELVKARSTIQLTMLQEVIDVLLANSSPPQASEILSCLQSIRDQEVLSALTKRIS